ncbi:MAG: hypothetical protein FD163_2516 [Hyphomonadaceae bacterium]|nr:MAG: hypothetical protein FD128_1587 [Hyphomonadaceae bacterium]KAF0182726.1 MAG: hypothetical protein FD163_2516 [Hyphomonadaceae bacterium]
MVVQGILGIAIIILIAFSLAKMQKDKRAFKFEDREKIIRELETIKMKQCLAPS